MIAVDPSDLEKARQRLLESIQASLNYLGDKSSEVHLADPVQVKTHELIMEEYARAIDAKKVEYEMLWQAHLTAQSDRMAASMKKATWVMAFFTIVIAICTILQLVRAW